MHSWTPQSEQNDEQQELALGEAERILKELVLDIEAQAKHRIELRRKRRLEFALFVVLALFLHLPFLYVLDRFALNEHGAARQGPKKFRVQMMTRDPKSKKLAVRRPSPTPEKKDQLPDKQIVSTAVPEKSERPDQANYASEHDQKVKEQTKSSLTAPSKHVTTRPQLGAKKVETPDTVQRAEQRAGAARSPEQRPNEAPQTKGVGPKLSEPAQRATKPGQSVDSDRGGSHLVNLVPSWRQLEEMSGMPFNDHLENIEEDAETRLNTFQYKHATFFNRVKENVSREWDPGKQVRKLDPQGTLIGRRDLSTVLEIAIDKKGNVVEAKVKQPSGVYYLDNEAVRAFNEAGPFPNPPKAIFGKAEQFSFVFSFFISNEKGASIDFNWRPY